MQNSIPHGASGGHRDNRKSAFAQSQGSNRYVPSPGANHGNSSIPRYIPSHEIRPESSMSNISFMTQAQGYSGGVSLAGHAQQLYPAQPIQPTPQIGGEYNDSFAGGFGNGIHGALGNFNSIGSGPNNALSRVQPSPSPFMPQSNTFLNERNADSTLSGYLAGVDNNSSSTFNGVPSAGTHSLSRSVPNRTTTKAAELASMIRVGATEGPDEIDYGGSGHKNGRNYQVAQQRISRANAEAILAQQPAITASDLMTQRDADTKGNATAFVNVDSVPLPHWFNKLAAGHKPTVGEFFEVMPLMEACRYATASNAGVVRIRNIPYSTPRTEVAAFVGKNAKLVMQPSGTAYYGVHIIMERHSGKTMDAFIEFIKPAEAVFVVSQVQKRILQGRHPKLGDRHVEVEISSQEELMGELFPRARNVVWEGMTPRVLPNHQQYYEGIPAAGFTGFMQNEEITMMIKHAETPHRSPFAQRCPIRTFESMISTIHKYPWFSIEHVLMTERRQLFDAAHACLRALILSLRRSGTTQYDTCKPTQATLQELAVAILTCPGFSEAQKSQVIASLNQGAFASYGTSRGMNVKFGGNTPMSSMWPFQVLVRLPGAHEQLVEYFASLMRLATTGAESMTLADAHAMRASSGSANRFGKVGIDYGTATTIEEAGRIELRWLEKALASVLPRVRQQRAASTGYNG